MGQLSSNHKHPGYVPGPVPGAPPQHVSSAGGKQVWQPAQPYQAHQGDVKLPPIVAKDEKQAGELDAADGNMDGTYFGAPIHTAPKPKSPPPSDPWHRDRYGYDFPMLEEVVELSDHGKPLKPGQAPSAFPVDPVPSRGSVAPSAPYRPPSGGAPYRPSSASGHYGHQGKGHETPSFLSRHHHGDHNAVAEEFVHRHAAHQHAAPSPGRGPPPRSPVGQPRYDHGYDRGYGAAGKGRYSGKGGNYGYDDADRRYDDRAYPADYAYSQGYGRGQYAGSYDHEYQGYGGNASYVRPRYEEHYDYGYDFDHGRTYDHDYYGGYGGYGLPGY